ncbi:MAG TPA: hypothetical protein VF690_18915 [Hymenobacter sp.]|jgi:hypothetical protein
MKDELTAPGHDREINFLDVISGLKVVGVEAANQGSQTQKITPLPRLKAAGLLQKKEEQRGFAER